MVFKIVWSTRAINSYIQNVEYLDENWTPKEVKKFIDAVHRKLSILAFQPKTGRLTARKLHVRQTVIHKRIILIYRCKPLKREVELIRFYNTHQKPNRLKK